MTKTRSIRPTTSRTNHLIRVKNVTHTRHRTSLSTTTLTITRSSRVHSPRYNRNMFRHHQNTILNTIQHVKQRRINSITISRRLTHIHPRSQHSVRTQVTTQSRRHPQPLPIVNRPTMPNTILNRQNNIPTIVTLRRVLQREATRNRHFLLYRNYYTYVSDRHMGFRKFSQQKMEGSRHLQTSNTQAYKSANRKGQA